MRSKKVIWAGYIMSALPVLLLLFSGFMKLMNPPSVVEGFAHLGYDGNIALWLGLVELLSTVLYLISRTSVLGAILLTGYLGGATASHLRIGEPFHAAVILGVLIWEDCSCVMSVCGNSSRSGHSASMSSSRYLRGAA
jgi:hypothetical protein